MYIYIYTFAHFYSTRRQNETISHIPKKAKKIISHLFKEKNSEQRRNLHQFRNRIVIHPYAPSENTLSTLVKTYTEKKKKTRRKNAAAAYYSCFHHQTPTNFVATVTHMKNKSPASCFIFLFFYAAVTVVLSALPGFFTRALLEQNEETKTSALGEDDLQSRHI